MNLTSNELAANAMEPTWRALTAVKNRDDALTQFLREELPDRLNTPWGDIVRNAASMTAALQLCGEFNEIWPHHVPTVWELVIADRAGKLAETITELNNQFTQQLVGGKPV